MGTLQGGHTIQKIKFIEAVLVGWSNSGTLLKARLIYISILFNRCRKLTHWTHALTREATYLGSFSIMIKIHYLKS